MCSESRIGSTVLRGEVAAPRAMRQSRRRLVDDASTELCTRCGFCCDGVLFDVVRLTPPEVERMTRLGLPVLPRVENPAMPQPCAALEGTRCRIYPDRPARCDDFRCHLLAALQAGELDLDEALGVVALARELVGAQRTQFLDRHFLGRRRLR